MKHWSRNTTIAIMLRCLAFSRYFVFMLLKQTMIPTNNMTGGSTVVDSVLCSISSQESEYFHNTFHGRNTEYQNDADFNHISRLSARLQAYNHHTSFNQSKSTKSPQFILFIVGLNQGSLLRTFLRCPTDSSTHSFDIQAELIKTAKKKFGTKKKGILANNLHFEALGMSNETTIGHVGGDTVTAGQQSLSIPTFSMQYRPYSNAYSIHVMVLSSLKPILILIHSQPMLN